MLTGTLVAVVRPPLRNARQRWGTALFLVGVVGIAGHLFLSFVVGVVVLAVLLYLVRLS